ncbi:F-BAR and double SH3 domains protein 2-like [Lytechinus pictus]|uniref:F-BAR and double SH3 domains protein 2-like n=1 Tax=Lytechinus pictus TaxID=7653 RepID=UPI00240D4863|nr:F-BAR and double SH3 domains protein 2-like [Lytechinus pictus]
MQQPPPRKAKIGQDLKNVQHDQWAKLQSKHQADSDLLEDVRDFAKQRAAIEKVYAQSLQKLSTQFIQKRTFSSPTEGPEEQRDR